jgi:hypothetical protein
MVISGRPSASTTKTVSSKQAGVISGVPSSDVDTSKYVLLADGTYVDKSAFEQLPEDVQRKGLTDGLDALQTTLQSKQSDYKDAMKMLEPWTDKDGKVDLVKAVKEGVDTGRLKDVGIVDEASLNKVQKYLSAVEKVKVEMHHGQGWGGGWEGGSVSGIINVLDKNGNISGSSIISYYSQTKDDETVKDLGYDLEQIKKIVKRIERRKEERREAKDVGATAEEIATVVYDPVTNAPIVPPKLPKAVAVPVTVGGMVVAPPSQITVVPEGSGIIETIKPKESPSEVYDTITNAPIIPPGTEPITEWKPGADDETAYVGVTKDYIDKVNASFVPTLENPLPPYVGQVVDTENNLVLDDKGNPVTVDEFNAKLPEIDIKVKGITEGILSKTSTKLSDGQWVNTEYLNSLPTTLQEIAKVKGIDALNNEIKSVKDKLNQYRNVIPATVVGGIIVTPPSVEKVDGEDSYNTQSIYDALRENKISENDLSVKFGKENAKFIVESKLVQDKLRNDVAWVAEGAGIKIADKNNLTVNEIQNLIESNDKWALALGTAGYDVNKINQAIDNIEQKRIEAQSKLQPYSIDAGEGPWDYTVGIEKPEPIQTLETLAKFQRDNPNDTTTLKVLYGEDGSKLYDEVKKYNSNIIEYVNYLDKQVTPTGEFGTFEDVALRNAVDRATNQLGFPITKGGYVNTYLNLNQEDKIKVARLVLQDPARSSWLGTIGADIDVAASENLVSGLVLGGIQPITHVVGKQVTIDEARSLLNDTYESELNSTKEFKLENGTIDIERLKNKMFVDDKYKENILKETGYSNKQDLIDNLNYYNNGVKITGEEWATAGATAALDLLSLIPAVGAGRVFTTVGGKIASVGIPVASAGVFLPSSMRTIVSPTSTTGEKILAGSMPLILIAGGAVGLKGIGKTAKPEDVANATLGVKEKPVNTMLDKAVKDVSVAGTTTRTIANVKAVLPETIKTINDAGYKTEVNLEKIFQRLDDAVVRVRDYKGNLIKLKEAASNLGGDVRVKFDNALYKIELNGEKMAQSFQDLVTLSTDYKRLWKQVGDALNGRVKVGIATLEDMQYRLGLTGEQLAQKFDDITSKLTDYRGNWQELKSTLGEIGGDISAKVGDILYKGELNTEQFAQQIDDIINQVKEYKGNWPALKNSVQNTVKKVTDVALNTLYKMDVNLEKLAQRIEDGMPRISDVKSGINEIKQLTKDLDTKIRDGINETAYKLDLNSERIVQQLDDYKSKLLDYNTNWKEFKSKVKDVAKLTKEEWDNVLYKLDVSGEKLSQSFDNLVSTITDYKRNLNTLKSTISEVKGDVGDSLYKAGLKFEEYAQKLDDLIEQSKTKRELVHLDYLKKSAKNLKEDFSVELRIAELERTIKSKLSNIKSRLDAGVLDELQAEAEIKKLRDTTEWVEHTRLVSELAKEFNERTKIDVGYKVSRLDKGLENLSRSILGEDIAKQRLPFDVVDSLKRGDITKFEQYVEELKKDAEKLPEEQKVEAIKELTETQKMYNDLVQEFKEGKLSGLKVDEISITLPESIVKEPVIEGITYGETFVNPEGKQLVNVDIDMRYNIGQRLVDDIARQYGLKTKKIVEMTELEKQTFEGTYDTLNDVIKLKTNDIKVILHELSHAEGVKDANISDGFIQIFRANPDLMESLKKINEKTGTNPANEIQSAYYELVNDEYVRRISGFDDVHHKMMQLDELNMIGGQLGVQNLGNKILDVAVKSVDKSNPKLIKPLSDVTIGVKYLMPEYKYGMGATEIISKAETVSDIEAQLKKQSLDIERQVRETQKDIETYLGSIQQRTKNIAELDVQQRRALIDDLKKYLDSYNELQKRQTILSESQLKSIQDLIGSLEDYLKNPNKELDFDNLFNPESLQDVVAKLKEETSKPSTLTPEEIALYDELNRNTQQLNESMNLLEQGQTPESYRERVQRESAEGISGGRTMGQGKGGEGVGESADFRISELTTRNQEIAKRLSEISAQKEKILTERFEVALNKRLKELGYSDDYITALGQSRKLDIVGGNKPYISKLAGDIERGFEIIEERKVVEPVKEPWQMTKDEYKKNNPHSGGALTGDAEAFDKLSDDAIVTVFHATSQNNANKLLTGKGLREYQGKGILGESDKLYVGSDPVSVEGYGEVILALKVKKGQLLMSPEARWKNSVGESIIDAGTGALLDGDPISVSIVENARYIRGHEALVKQAISEGKDVSPDVLKDYPDLVIKNPWEMTKDEAIMDSRIKLGGKMDDTIARAEPDGKITLSDDYFEHSTGDKKNIWLHEVAHYKSDIILKDSDVFWSITDSNLFGKYNEVAMKWKPNKGFYGRNVDEAITQALVDYELDPVAFLEKHPEQFEIIKVISKEKDLSKLKTKIDDILKGKQKLEGGEGGVGLPEEKPTEPKEGGGGVAVKERVETKPEIKTEVKPETKKNVMTPTELEELMKKKTETPSKFFEVPKTETEIEPFVIPDVPGESYYTIVWEDGKLYTKLMTPEIMRRGYVEIETDTGRVLASRDDLLRMTVEQSRKLLGDTDISKYISGSPYVISYPSQKVFDKPKDDTKTKPVDATEPRTIEQPEPITGKQPIPIKGISPFDEPVVETPPSVKDELKYEFKPATLLLSKTADGIRRTVLPTPVDDKSKDGGIKKFSDVVPKEGVITWRQGAIWHYVEPPYTKDDFHTTSKPLAGTYKFFTGTGSAYKTLQVLPMNYRLEKDVVVDLGWAKIHIVPKGRGNNLEIKYLEGEKANVDKRLPEGGTVRDSYVDNPEEIKHRGTYADLRDAYDYSDIGLRPSDVPDTLTERIPKGLSIKQYIPNELRKTELPQYKAGRLKVYNVDAEWLRNQNVPMSGDKTSIDFQSGGHYYLYPDLIPKNEIWLDRRLGILDAKAELLHQLREYGVMSNKVPYDIAHSEYANPLEAEGRSNINALDTMIKHELDRFTQGKLKPQKMKQIKEESTDEEVVVKQRNESIRERSTFKKPKQQQNIVFGEPMYLGHKLLVPRVNL